MADTVFRLWYVVVRRRGVVTQRLQVRILPDEGDSSLDQYAGPTYRDFEMVDVGSAIDLGPADSSVIATYELTATTQPWEAQYLE